MNFFLKYVFLFRFFYFVNENEKKLQKNGKFKILKNKQQKNDLEIWWIGTFHKNLPLIHLAVSEKMMSTDGRRTDGRRRTTDDRFMTVALLCSSRK